jgi:DNA polymerase III sliding clamp (beta) subunit (PCNA family)
MLVPSQIFPISKICDVESTRYALNSVQLERDAQGPVAIATDGRRLIAVRWNEASPDEFPKSIGNPAKPDEWVAIGDASHVENFQVLITAKSWNEAAKLPPKKSAKAILSNVLVEEPSANGTVRMAATDLETIKQITPRSAEGRFPRWRDVMPKEQSGSITVSLDAAKLAEVCAVLAKMVTDDSSRGVDITFTHEEKAVTITKTLNGVSATAVIMPLAREK